jgi:signal transduction histidine kinase
MMRIVPSLPAVTTLPIKAALLAASAATLGIWLLAGYYFSQRIAETESRAAAISSSYMQAQDSLTTIRAQVLLGSVYVRDALLDPNPSTGETVQIEDSFAAVEGALARYPVLDLPEDRARFDQLQKEIDAFHQAMLAVLASNRRSPQELRTVLQTQVVPRRDTVIRISEEARSLNRSIYVQQQVALRAVYATSQRWLWLVLGLALLASVAVALAAASYAGGLEQRVRQQSLHDAQTAAEMQRLSTKLITAQEEERRTIARELHDEVGQVLTAIKVELALAQRTIESSGGSVDILLDARSMAESGLATVRDLSQLLHPAILDDLGLPAALEWCVRGFSKRFDIPARFYHDGIIQRLPANVETSVYRIVQEALTNIARHARASACRVHLQHLINTVIVTIEDDGVGFNPTEAAAEGAAKGLGLVGIRERVAHLRGSLRVHSAPNAGTRLFVELPITASPQDP